MTELSSESVADIFTIISFVIYGLAVLISSTVHEFAHAFVATKLGDLTPKINDRLTLNPLAHIDPIGALSLLLFRFGWSKPVPINPYNFNNPVVGTALTSAAGPIANIAFAALLGASNFIIRMFSPELAEVAVLFIIPLIIINISLAIFNLLPVSPLDGFKVVSALLPTNIRYKWENLEPYGIYILILLILPYSPLSPFFSAFFSNAINFILSIIII